MIVPFLYRGDASRRMRIVIANGTAGIEQRGEDLAGGERWTSVDLSHESTAEWVKMVALAVTDETTEAYARAFASEWLRSELGIDQGEDVPPISITPDGDGSFAFSIQADELPPGCEDSTSYMRIDAYGEVAVEWMGAVGATITNESADHFGPTIEIPDLATAREYVGRVALLGHRAGGEGSIYDDAGICWGSSGTLSIGDRDRIFMAQGVTATTSRSIHDGVVIRLLDVGETIPEPPAEQVVRRRGSRTLQMPEATPHHVARVLFDIADALRLDTDAAWAIEDLAAEVELAAAVMAKAGLS